MKAERFFVLVTFEKVLGDGDEHCLEDEVVSCASRWSWGGQGGDSQSTVVCLLMCSSNLESFRLQELLKGQHSRKTRVRDDVFGYILLFTIIFCRVKGGCCPGAEGNNSSFRI